MSEFGRALDQVCESSPEIMSKVVDLPFGSLMSYFSHNAMTRQQTACLVGNMFVASGIGRVSAVYGHLPKLAEMLGVHTFDLRYLSGNAPLFSAKLQMRYNLNTYNADQLAVRYITNRIRRKLMMMELAKKVETEAPVHA